MTKRITVKVWGYGVIHDVDVSPETTAADVLAALNLEDCWELFLKLGTPPFAKTDRVHDKVGAGTRAFAIQCNPPG